MMIQIAGVRSKQDLDVIVGAGVDYIGFPLRLGYHAEDIPDKKVRELVGLLPTTVKPVLITYLNQADPIIELSQFIGVEVIQIHSQIEVSELVKLREKVPSIKLIKSLVVRENNLEELSSLAKNVARYVDFFITDTFDPTTGAEGATGKIHNWEISRELVRLSTKPVILAGGIKPSNVKDAIEFVKPYGVDSHTGVENSKGDKDPELVNSFVKLAHEAFAKLSL